MIRYAATLAVAYDKASEAPIVRTATDAAAVLRQLYPAGEERERLAVIVLDNRSRVIELGVLTVGAATCTVVDPGQILRYALTRARVARAIVMAHNHPSGDTSPSVDDQIVTRKMKTACDAVGLQLLDHVILGDGADFSSLAERGYL